ncbi:MAG TPA: glycosyltransferase [Chitinophagaceae bacterium]|nr:glycosyltransferase [Chitinophagaceae bacterium]
MNEPVVTVCIITYNHKNFIAEAIESVLQQKADFYWSIVIADDFSTDGTRNIVIEYAKKYPDKISLILQEKNVGLQQNFVDLFTFPRSKYVAFLDGDDIWLDEYRLEKQVRFLEENHDYSMVYGKYTLMNENGKAYKENKLPGYKSGYIFHDVIQYKYLPPMTASLMRNDLIKVIYKDRTKPGIDYYLIAMLCKDHKAFFINENYFCYRINEASITSSHKELVSKYFLNAIKEFEPEYPHLVKKGRRNGKRMVAYLIADKHPTYKNLLLLLHNWNFSFLYFRQLIKCLLRCLRPGLAQHF